MEPEQVRPDLLYVLNALICFASFTIRKRHAFVVLLVSTTLSLSSYTLADPLPGDIVVFTFIVLSLLFRHYTDDALTKTLETKQNEDEIKGFIRSTDA